VKARPLVCFSGLPRHHLYFVLRVVAILSTISLGVLTAQPPVEVEQRIRHIQDSILPAVFTKGEPPATINLADRMVALHVPGVSIAVIHDGKIAAGTDWRYSGGGFVVTQLGLPSRNSSIILRNAASLKDAGVWSYDLLSSGLASPTTRLH
jgi:hypothetical protein